MWIIKDVSAYSAAFIRNGGDRMERKRRLRMISWILISVMVLLDLPANTIHVSADSGMSIVQVLNFSEKEIVSESKTDLTYEGFTIKAISSKSVKMDKSEKTSEYNHSFTKRLKSGGAGAADYRTIYFTTAQANAVVTVYALSASAAANRTFKIYDSDGTAVTDALTALGEDHITDKEGKIPAVRVTLGAAGTYYICPDASINFYYVSVTEGVYQEDAFTDGTKPSIVRIDRNVLDENTLDVTISGTITNPSTDRLWVKMYDEKGDLVDDAKVANLSDGKATVKLTPEEGGIYSLVCEAIRGGTKVTYKSEEKEYIFTPALTKVSIDSILTNNQLGLDVTWSATAGAERYSISIAEQGSENYTLVKKDIIFKTESYTCSIPSELVAVGKTYTVKLEAFDAAGKSISTTLDKKVRASAERFQSALVGSGASGTVTVNEDTGAVRMEAVAVGSGSGGKLADSEDGFIYYYTEINPEKENFTLTATFTVIDSSNKDNQSGFGIMAIDDFIDGTSSARYFNSAGCMVRKYSRNIDGVPASTTGIPGGYFVTGYTGAPTTSSSTRKLIDTAPFDWDWKSERLTPRFQDGDVITLTLKKDNTGFHAIMEGYDEIICYEPDLLLKQDSSKYYVGICASRKIIVEASNLIFTTSDPVTDPAGISRPQTTVTASAVYDSASTASGSTFEIAFKADYAGTVNVYDADNHLVAEDLKVDPRKDNTLRVTAEVTLQEGTNHFKAIFTPGTDEQQGELLGNAETLNQTPIKVTFDVSYKKYGTSNHAIYASPVGSSVNKGTKSSPLDVHTAVAYAQPGQEIVLLGGTYQLTSKILIERGHNGTAESPITLMAQPGAKVTFDLTNSPSGGIMVSGDYWHIYDIEVCNAPGNAKPVQVSGHHNIIEKVVSHDNGYTGIQISGDSKEPSSMWPSHNLILSCESYNNCDPLANDADGFAAKLTCGEENVFRYCISHHNIDDGWDLYAKSTTGAIGAVLIDQCVAYNNGYLTEEKGSSIQGEGNGFKLGGESIAVKHKLVNSISFSNLANGVFSNSNPSCIIENVTSYANEKHNLQLNTNASATTWELSRFISYGTAQNTDSIDVRNQANLESITNYLNGRNTSGIYVTDAWFESIDTTVKPTIAEDGSIDMHGLLQLTESAVSGIGGTISSNPNPTLIEVGKEIGTEEPTVQPSIMPSSTPSMMPTVQPTSTPTISKEPVKKTSVAKPVIKTNLDASKSHVYELGGYTTTLKVSATGKDVTYQWYYNTRNAYSGATKIKGAVGKTYKVSSAKLGTRYYFCKVTAHDSTKDIKTASVNSSKAKITIKKKATKPKKAVITLNLLKGKNGSVKKYQYNVGNKTTPLKVNATGSRVTYQWYYNTVDSYKGAKKVEGATSKTLKPSSSTKGTVYYFCKISTTDKAKEIPTVTVYSRKVKVIVKKKSGK